MDNNLDPKIINRIHLLEEKFKNSGQDLGSYLDGLLHDRYLTYWDYIHLDTLLSLQIPRTHFPDEEIFITYHQITELYFKLIIHELKQIIENKFLKVDFFIDKLTRINRYFKVLTDSFEIMVKGMDKEQFLQYRMSLLPASGFQSVQFRMIEIFTTPLCNLAHLSIRKTLNETDSIENSFESLYWKYGATENKTGEKTLTLKQFEERYTPRLKRIATQVKENSIYFCYKALSTQDQNNTELIEELKKFDKNVNVQWSLAHLKAAYKYLNKENNKEIKATGGTNWKQFLPPNFQKISFFPFLWNEEELENWGKKWVEDLVNA